MPVPLNVGPRGKLDARSGHPSRLPAIAAEHQVERFGIPTVTIERATYDAVLLADDEREAVVAVDNMLAAEIVSIPMMRAFAECQQRRRERVDWALGLANEHSRRPTSRDSG